MYVEFLSKRGINMVTKIGKSDWAFLCLCLLLGVIAEEAFFRGQIGISYFIFVAAFYSVFFWRYRRFSFSHQRFGYLILICIWFLSASFFLNDELLFYVLNFLSIPVLVIFHLVLITSPKSLEWNRLGFLAYIFFRLLDALKYNFSFVFNLGKGLKQRVNGSKLLVWKKVFIGIIISIPVLLIVLKLLTAADTQFEKLVGGIPQWFQIMDAESTARWIVILILTIAFFGVLQVLYKKQIKVMEPQFALQSVKVDGIIAITLLVLINVVYVLFTIVQFKYFFSGTLQGDYTYAEYARKGFFELLFVTLINLSITILVLTFVNRTLFGIKRFIQILLTILVLTSAVMLCSAFLRLGMYEDAYGFTFTRVLVHSFMIFLVIIFTYTLVKIWVEKLSLFHFYFISSLLYYTAISVINIDRIVVKENMTRYEESGKIDVQYLSDMSATGVLGLIDLYKKEPDVPGLKNILKNKQYDSLRTDEPWQSFNLQRERANQELKKLQLR
jgi:hypothetical protein